MDNNEIIEPMKERLMDRIKNGWVLQMEISYEYHVMGALYRYKDDKIQKLDARGEWRIIKVSLEDFVEENWNALETYLG